MKLDKFGFQNQGHNYARFRPSYNDSFLGRLFTRHSGLRQRYLDVATGTGQLLFKLAPHFAKAVGLDLSKKMIATCQEIIKENRQDNIQLLCSDWKSAMIKQQKFDLITIGQALHWLNIPDFLESAKTKLNPKGTLIVLGYYPHGIEYMDHKTPERGLQHYKVLHEKLRPFFDFDREDLRLKYPQQKYGFRKVFKDIARDEELCRTQMTFDQFKNYVKTFSAFGLYKESHGNQQVLQQFEESCREDGIVSTSRVRQVVSYFGIVLSD